MTISKGGRMYKIAFSGMKGRKKDSFLMAFVITLSFVFIVSATLLHASSEATKHDTKIKSYGLWENALFNATISESQYFLEQTKPQRYATTELIGSNPIFGNIGTYSESLQELANFQIIEGQMPQSDDEIALEYEQLQYHDENLTVGDTYTIQIRIPLIYLERSVASEIQNERVKKAAENTEAGGYIQSNTRNELAYEMFDSIKAELKTSYLYHFYSTGQSLTLENQNEEIINNGTIMSQEIILTKTFTISGIFETYSTIWDVGDYVMPNAFISQDAGRELIEVLYNNRMIEITDYKVPVNTFISTNIDPLTFFNQFSSEFKTLHKNNLTYPNNPYSPDTALTYGILALIFIGTMASVFQINLTQIKRRSRKLTLFKSIGATNKQIATLILWEFTILLLICIPLGIGIGFGIGLGSIYYLATFREIHLLFDIDPTLLISGVLFGILSVFLGMLFPLYKALKTPLTGTMSTPPKRTHASQKHQTNAQYMRKLKRQTYLRISITHAKFEKKKHFITSGLYTLAMTCLLATLLLAFIAFGPYIDGKIAVSKPDFGLNFIYGLSNKDVDQIQTELMSINGVSHADVLKYGQGVFLYHENLKSDPLYTALYNQLTPEERVEKFGIDEDFVNIDDSNTHLVNEALMTNVYAIDTDSALYDKLTKALEPNTINSDAFNSGKEVILLMPGYKLDEGITVTYDFRKSDLSEHNYPIKVNDTLYLTIPTEMVVETRFTNDVAFHETTVGGIIHHFEPFGIWPFSSTSEHPVVITSNTYMNKLFPATVRQMRFDREVLRSIIATMMPNRFGRSSVAIYLNPNADLVSTQLDIQRLGVKYGAKLDNYNLENEILLGKSFRSALNIIVLGASIALITLLILYNTSLSKLEQERERIGTLQALGVTKNQFRRFYVGTGCVYALIALIIAHIVNFIILIGATLLQGNISVVDRLWLYPWKIHGLICLIFGLITILSYFLPLEKILERQPINNIQNLQD